MTDFFYGKKKNLKEKIPYYFKFIKEKYMYCIGIKDVYEDYSGNKFEYFSFSTIIFVTVAEQLTVLTIPI